jgi:hypothetical protein
MKPINRTKHLVVIPAENLVIPSNVLPDHIRLAFPSQPVSEIILLEQIVKPSELKQTKPVVEMKSFTLLNICIGSGIKAGIYLSDVIAAVRDQAQKEQQEQQEQQAQQPQVAEVAEVAEAEVVDALDPQVAEVPEEAEPDPNEGHTAEGEYNLGHEQLLLIES